MTEQVIAENSVVVLSIPSLTNLAANITTILNLILGEKIPVINYHELLLPGQSISASTDKIHTQIIQKAKFLILLVGPKAETHTSRIWHLLKDWKASRLLGRNKDCLVLFLPKSSTPEQFGRAFESFTQIDFRDQNPSHLRPMLELIDPDTDHADNEVFLIFNRLLMQ